MKVLVINTGSSSIKYQLINMNNEELIAGGLVERIGEAGNAKIKHQRYVNGKEEESVKEFPIANHQVGLDSVVALLTDKQTGVIQDKAEVKAVGHRAVHGGEKFSSSVVITKDVIKAIEDCVPLAPLHNPANLTGIRAAMEIFSKVPHVAVFDTAFHQTMPSHAFRYALPETLYKEHHVRRYGFHGTSHLFVSRAAAEFMKKPLSEFNCVTIHIGNGASMAAIKNGKSIDTTMGLTPLEGLVMGTRCGDIDPAIPYFMQKNLGMDVEKVNSILNKESGMKGITGKNDLRDIEDAYIKTGCPTSTLALTMYAYRIKKYIGAYMAIIGKLDAIIFTAGVGQNSDIIRGMVCSDLDHMGISLDLEKNKVRANRQIFDLSQASSKVRVLAVPTNEELEIARQTKELL